MTAWPDGYRGALSLTFDDGMPSHVSAVIPGLDDRGLRATFYVSPSGREDDPTLQWTWWEGLARFESAFASGHEIGDHTIAHPCSLNIDTDRMWGRVGRNLANWSLSRIEADIVEAEMRFDRAFPSRGSASFAYPCYESDVGRGASRVSYTPFVARMFVAARAGGSELRGELANDPSCADLHRLTSFPAEGRSAAWLNELTGTAVELGRWAIFTFHGVDEGHLSIAAHELVAFLDHLALRRDEIWIAPVREVAAWIRSKEAA